MGGFDHTGVVTCLACRGASSAMICPACRRSLRRAPDRLVGPVLVRSAFEHDGAARLLVHRLKYDAVWGVADRLCGAMAPLLQPEVTALVPVPRVTLRRLRYGIDPAVALARALGRRTGVPVVAALVPMMWASHRAGPAGRRRGVQRFRLRGAIPEGAVLIDDVVTTGTTLRAAATVTGVRHAITVTAGHSALTPPGRAS